MNEGCEGGWAMFNGYFAEGAHLVSEQCAPYRGTTHGDSCKQYKNCAPVARVESSKLLSVSSTQTQISQATIMKEILRNGPVVGEFKAPSKFRYYDGGVLTDGEDKPASAETTNKLLGISDSEFVQLGIANQNLDHSVMIMGWGVSPQGMDVWIVRNTFGQNWGEKGDFYIRRGQNDFGIESEVSAYEPVLL